MRKLTEQDHDDLIRYISREIEYNTYILGDVEKFGIEGDIVSIYANDEKDSNCYILMKYLSDFVVYSDNLDFNVAEIAEFIKNNHVDSTCISGKSEIIKKLAAYFENVAIRDTQLSCLKKFSPDYVRPDISLVRKLTETDTDEILKLYLQIAEFSHKYFKFGKKEKDNIRLTFQSGRSFVIIEDGKVASIISTTSESATSAMLTNLATHPLYRNKGYGNKTLFCICQSLFSEGKKSICLYYDNFTAGHLYDLMGFEKVGIYSTLRFNKQHP